MAQFKSSPENEAKRLRAYELYLGSSIDGKRRSLRSIAHELGCTLSAVQYWRDVDQWDRRVNEALKAATRSAELAASTIKMNVRDALMDGVLELKKILQNGKATEKISAVRTLGELAARLQAIDFGGPANPIAAEEWKDDLPTPPSEPQPPQEETSTADQGG